CRLCLALCLFFFNAPATAYLYTLSLHDALPICRLLPRAALSRRSDRRVASPPDPADRGRQAGRATALRQVAVHDAGRRDLQRRVSGALAAGEPAVAV